MSQITQKGATGALALQAGGSFQSSTDANLATLVGTRWDLSDGREVILVSNSAVAIGSAGVLCQDSPTVANHQGLAVTAVQAYSANGNIPATVTVTLGATALTANAYQGGFAVIDSGAGGGQTLRIASNPAALSSGTGVVITLEDAPNVALTTASTVCLIPAHGAGVVINPTTATSVPCGVTLYPLAASAYGFLTSKGITSAFSDASVAAIGTAIAASVTTAGFVTAVTGTGAITLNTSVIGNTLQLCVTQKARAVFVNL